MGALEGKVAIVTGAGHGLGRSHALALAREGARVVANDLGIGLLAMQDPGRTTVDETVALIEHWGGAAIAHFGDAADWTEAHAMIELAITRFGRLDILVNNAGILRNRFITNMTADEWDQVVRVNLRGTFCPTRHACAYWKSEAKGRDDVAGRVINTTSCVGLFGHPYQENYAASKAGIIGFTLSLAQSMAPYGVTVNAIAPLAADTVSLPEVPEPMQEIYSAERLRRFTSDQVSPLVAYLASDRAAHLTGRIFHVGAGRIDAVEGPKLVPGHFKAAAPWTVDELAKQFANNDAAPPAFRERMRELASWIPVDDALARQKVRS